MIEATSPKFRVLKPNKLMPPSDVKRIKLEKIHSRKMKNPVFRFFFIFFGEGF